MQQLGKNPIMQKVVMHQFGYIRVFLTTKEWKIKVHPYLWKIVSFM